MPDYQQKGPSLKCHIIEAKYLSLSTSKVVPRMILVELHIDWSSVMIFVYPKI